MSDRIFYVGAHAQKDRNKITGFVASKFLTVDGKPVVDPTPKRAAARVKHARERFIGPRVQAILGARHAS
jgi:hypothetical protein